MTKENRRIIVFLSLGILLFLGFILRVFGNNWDQQTHLHPDERMLIMVAERIEFPNELDPDFYNYGSFPVYLLAGLAQFADELFDASWDSYDGLLPLGRLVVSILDVGTILLVWLLAKEVFKNKKIAFAAATIYTLSFFPIQNSNFFVVDNFLNFLMSLLTLVILKQIAHPKMKWVVMMGVVFGAMLATKITPIILAPACILMLALKAEDGNIRFRGVGRWLRAVLLFVALTLITHIILMPYAYLNWSRFISDIFAQIEMNSNAYVFPYTLQYVETTAYWFYVKNIVLWGVGPIILGLFVAGIVLFGLGWLGKNQPRKIYRNWSGLIYIGINLFFFLIIGRSSVKFMRYLLPVYPFLSVMAGYGLIKLVGMIKNRFIRIGLVIVLLLSMTAWTLGFLKIYTQKHPRIEASEWIREYIPVNSVLAVEHWDDRLPLFHGGVFLYEELELYNLPDGVEKWLEINQQLENSDYLILASNRLYTPLMKLDDCEKYRKCYPITSKYYEMLLSGNYGFAKVAEFTNYPKILGLELDDQTADESFSVYDHPKVIILKNVTFN